MKEKALVKCKIVRKGKDPALEAMLKNIIDFQLSLVAPKNFDSTDPTNHIKHLELSFEKLVASLEERGVSNPIELTVFQFYAKIRYFREKKPAEHDTTRRPRSTRYRKR